MKTSIDAVIVQENIKGRYERYALTPDEFVDEFAFLLIKDMPYPSDEGCAYTVAPMTHMWYKKTKTGSDEWNDFFTNMSKDLPESDIVSGNFASIAEHGFGILKEYLPEIMWEFYCTVGDLRIYNNYMLILEKETEKSYIGKVMESDGSYNTYGHFRLDKEKLNKAVLTNGKNEQYYKVVVPADLLAENAYVKAQIRAVKIIYNELLEKAKKFKDSYAKKLI